MVAKYTQYWEKERAACAACGRSYFLTLNGVLPQHYPDAYTKDQCPGSHQPPPPTPKPRPTKAGPVAPSTLRYRALAELARRHPDEYQTILDELTKNS